VKRWTFDRPTCPSTGNLRRKRGSFENEEEAFGWEDMSESSCDREKILHSTQFEFRFLTVKNRSLFRSSVVPL
jgi:hypothetical protein